MRSVFGDLLFWGGILYFVKTGVKTGAVVPVMDFALFCPCVGLFLESPVEWKDERDWNCVRRGKKSVILHNTPKIYDFESLCEQLLRMWKTFSVFNKYR